MYTGEKIHQNYDVISFLPSLSKHWGYSKIWPMLQPLLFYEGNTIHTLHKTKWKGHPKTGSRVKSSPHFPHPNTSGWRGVINCSSFRIGLRISISRRDMIGENTQTSVDRWTNDLGTHSTDTSVDSNKLTYIVQGRKDLPQSWSEIISLISRETRFRSQY